MSESSLAPSACCHRFYVNDTRCPLLLGKGMGPIFYNSLYQLWTEVQTKDLSWFQTNASNTAELTVSLLRRMREIDSHRYHEGFLSTTISLAYQRMIPLFASEPIKPFDLAHQVFVPNKSSVHVDIAATYYHGDSVKVHSLLKVKWGKEMNECPESEVTACGSLFHSTDACDQPWIPVLVISKSHLKIGVAFRFIGERWAYSEIFEFDNGAIFNHQDNDHVLWHLRFALFFHQAANFHRSETNIAGVQNLVDRHGVELLREVSVLGSRVLKGIDNGKNIKILKFYACKEDAERALAAERQVSRWPVTAVLVEGCMVDGMHAVLDNFHLRTNKVTYNHLINLTKEVDRMWKSGLIQGDLRLPNIIFGFNDDVIIIDWEWAGLVGVAKFPSNANAKSFGPTGANAIVRGGPIPMSFDFTCLADLLNTLHCSAAAEFAGVLNAARVIEVLLTMDPDGLVALNTALEPYLIKPTTLDLRCLGLHYYTRVPPKNAQSSSGALSENSGNLGANSLDEGGSTGRFKLPSKRARGQGTL